jgi:hypothetical protein
LYQQDTLPTIRPSADQTTATAWCDKFDRKDASPLGIRRVLTQVCHDLYGTKDVQNVITATYVWLADQIGHLTLGLVPTLLLCWLVTLLIPQDTGFANALRIVLYVAAAAGVFAVWVVKERQDLKDTSARAGGVFPFDSGDIVWNVKTALLYFGIGGLLGLAAFISWKLCLVALLLALWPAAAVAYWWQRRKLAFQQAGLPYLYRLANFTSPLEAELKDTVAAIANLRDSRIDLLDVLIGRDRAPKPGEPAIRHLLITGPLNAGKTSLCAGMGTEFAFALGKARYLTAKKLIELALSEKASSGARDYDDGRILWGWQDCDLLLIDDVDAGVSVLNSAGAKSDHFIQAESFGRALSADRSMPALQWLRGRRSVWVLGDPSEAGSWRQTIAGLMGVGETEVGLVRLELVPAEPEARTRSERQMGRFIK